MALCLERQRSNSIPISCCSSCCRPFYTRPPSSLRFASSRRNVQGDLPARGGTRPGDNGRRRHGRALFAFGFDWAPAFVLGAIVSPTDPVAATAIGRQLGVPNRIISIVEGESLINDGTALVAYKFAVAAVVTGSFSLLEASGEFIVSATGESP